MKDAYKESILEIRGWDRKDMSDEEYLKYFMSQIVWEPISNIEYGFVLPEGEMIGWTETLTSHINIHRPLAVLLCDRLEIETENPLWYLDEIGSIKICNDQSFMWITENPLPDKQIERWLKILEGMKYPIFDLGLKERYFSLSQIKGMDKIMLKKHLTC